MGAESEGGVSLSLAEMKGLVAPSVSARPATSPNGHAPTASSGINAFAAFNAHSVSSEVAAFPTEVLPSVAAEVVAKGAEALDCPPDFIGAPLLAMTGGVIGNRLSIELKQGYRQRPILWVAPIGEPGTAKSPALAIIQACLDTLQKEAHETRLSAKTAYQEAIDRWQGADKALRPPRPEMPPDEQHFYSTDSTFEGIARMLGGENAATPGFTMLREELAGWVQSFDAYRKGGDRQTWLSMWAGMAFKSDRAGRDSIYVPEPTVCVTGGIQPDVLPSLAPEAGQRDGFVERFLFAFPNAEPMGWTDKVLDQAALDALTDTFRQLRQAPTGVVRLEPPAASRFAAWFGENAALQAALQKEVSGLIRGCYAKLPNQAARIALILHSLAHPTNPATRLISVSTIESAIALAEYFRSHAHRTFGHFGEAVLVQHPLSVRILRALDRAGAEWAPMAELHRALGAHMAAEERHAALEELERVGLVESRVSGPGERRGPPQHEVRRVQTEKNGCALNAANALNTDTPVVDAQQTPAAQREESTDAHSVPKGAIPTKEDGPGLLCTECGKPATRRWKGEPRCLPCHPLGSVAPLEAA